MFTSKINPNVHTLNRVEVDAATADTLLKLVDTSDTDSDTPVSIHYVVDVALRTLARQLQLAEPVANRIPSEMQMMITS